MSDAERIAREVSLSTWPNAQFSWLTRTERALIDAALRGIALGRSQGACSEAEREFIEAWVSAGVWSKDNLQRWDSARNALLAERKPKWRVAECGAHVAMSPRGERREFWKNNGDPDPDTCAREVERLNAEAK